MHATTPGGLSRWLVISALAAATGTLHAAPAEWDGVSIAKIRAVGNYAGADTTFDNTVELWIANPPALPAGVNCTVNIRVYISANNKHMVAAAYLAMATGKKVNLLLDDTDLPMRASACEASYIDVLN